MSGTVPSAQASSIWKTNLHDPLIGLGHTVSLLDVNLDDYFVHAENARWLAVNRDQLTDALWEAYLSFVEKGGCDMVFLYFADGFVHPDVFQRIRSAGTPVINYGCNNIHQFHLVRSISMAVDLAVYAEKPASRSFDMIGARSYHMPMAANEKFYRRLDTSYAYDVSFVGQRYADRGQLLCSLINAGINVQAFGPKWIPGGAHTGNSAFRDKADKLTTIVRSHGPGYAIDFLAHRVIDALHQKHEDRRLREHVHGILSDDELVEVFNRSKINLGFSNVLEGARSGGRSMAHVRLRDFEVPMCGGFYLTGWTEELADYFEIGQEIETYRSRPELLEKAQYYLTHPEQREKIREAGLRRALQDHTWTQRLNMLLVHLSTIGLLNTR